MLLVDEFFVYYLFRDYILRARWYLGCYDRALCFVVKRPFMILLYFVAGTKMDCEDES